MFSPLISVPYPTQLRKGTVLQLRDRHVWCLLTLRSGYLEGSQVDGYSNYGDDLLYL